jgi:LytS/YehU family sensor histidine kinase
VALVWVVGWALVGVLCSTALAALYTRLPDRLLRGFPVFGVLLAACLTASVAWTLAMLGLEPVLGREPWAPPGVGLELHLAVGFFRGTFFFVLWSALFLVNLLSRRVQRQREDAVRAQALADQAQLQLLRSQVNPHFLFNALNSVVALIGEDPKAAKTMVRDVSALLRTSLDADGGRATSVAHELDFVRLYLKCEQVRFEDRLRVSWEVEDGVQALQVPPMLLHPLVENALKHGMHGAVDVPLEVRITVRREGRDLVLEVANSGTLTPPAGALLPPPSGIGLKNVRSRLAHLFPGRHGFGLEEAGGWVTARLTLPAEPG